jgi:hypothetical protein
MDRSIRHGIACESNPCPCNYNTGGGSGGGDGDGGNSTPIKKQAARIIKVIDGDTVRVKLKGGPKRDVRLLGIDTPEVYGGVECGGKAASKKLKKQLPRNTKVKLISDRTQPLVDKYAPRRTPGDRRHHHREAPHRGHRLQRRPVGLMHQRRWPSRRPTYLQAIESAGFTIDTAGSTPTRSSPTRHATPGQSTASSISLLATKSAH